MVNNRYKRNLDMIKSLEEEIESNKNIVEELHNFDEISEDVKQKRIDDLLSQNNDLKDEISLLKLSFNELSSLAKSDVKRMYLDDSDDRDWAVAWSGGKDSTVVMGIVVDVIKSLKPSERARKVHVVMSDTRMENPNLEEYMHEQIELLQEYSKRHELPIEVHLVSRVLEHSYFYLVLGRGYFLPQNSGAGRWCTDRLKITPQDSALKAINPSYIMMGTRSSESTQRRDSIDKWLSDKSISKKIGDHVNLPNTHTFMPIVDFTIDDVWEYLQKERLGWSSTHKVRTLYREATGECGFTSPKKLEMKATILESCGARFGCWTCPVILKDKSTEAMSQTNEWMKPLSDWRFLQLKVMGDYKPERPDGQKRKQRSKVLRLWEDIGRQIKFITKSGYKMNGNRMLDRKTKEPRNDWGTVTVAARKFMFYELLKTQDKVNELRVKLGLAPLELISEEEIVMIKDRWKEDEEERPWLLTNVDSVPISQLNELLEYGEVQTELINQNKV